jgi:hypothetical protein
MSIQCDFCDAAGDILSFICIDLGQFFVTATYTGFLTVLFYYFFTLSRSIFKPLTPGLNPSAQRS